MLAGDYLRALRLRRSAAAALDRLLTRVDALAAPTLPTVAWPLELRADEAYLEFPGGTDKPKFGLLETELAAPTSRARPTSAARPVCF